MINIITIKGGYLEKLLPGDVLLADRWFNIHDPPYPLQQLRRTCVAIAFPRTAAAAEREN